METVLAIIIGLFLTIAFGSFTALVIFFLDKAMEKHEKNKNRSKDYFWEGNTNLFYLKTDDQKSIYRTDELKRFDRKLGVMLGAVEVVIYYFSALLSAYSLVAGWLVLKSISSLLHNHRRKYIWETHKVYMIGVGFSLIFGVGGGLITRAYLELEVIPSGMVNHFGNQ